MVWSRRLWPHRCRPAAPASGTRTGWQARPSSLARMPASTVTLMIRAGMSTV